MGKKKKDEKVDQLVKCIAGAILDKKGKNVVSLEIGRLPNAVCKYFVICNADSTTQVGAIADNVEEKTLSQLNEKVWQSAGHENSFWIVLDYIDVVVHVFQTEWRNYYRLEELWADAAMQRYTDEPEIIKEKTKSNKNNRTLSGVIQ